MSLAALPSQQQMISASIQKIMFRDICKLTDEKCSTYNFPAISRVLQQQDLKVHVNLGTQIGAQAHKSMWNQALDGISANWHVLTYALPDVSWQL